MSLSSKHLADLRMSGLSDETIAAAGLYTEAEGDQVRDLLGGWLSVKNARKLGACLAFPYFGPAGEPMAYADKDGRSHTFVRLKPDNPRDNKKEKGKKIKYEGPVGTPTRAYFPPGTRAPVLDDPAVELVVTEGEKKSLCADQHGIRCIAIGGVWGWQVARPKDADGNGTGPRELIPDLAEIDWDGRTVIICFDSDIDEKPLVQFAEWHLAEQLLARGAVVKTVRLHALKDGKKCGLDDFVVECGPDALRKLLAGATPPVKPTGLGSNTSNDAPDDPHHLIEKFLDVVSPGGSPHVIRSWRDEIWRYDRGCYTPIPDGDLRARLADWTRDELVRANIAAYHAWLTAGEGKSPHPPTTCKVTTGLVNNMIQALSGACLLPARVHAPAWIDGPPGPEPTGIMAMHNGLLDLEAAALRKPDCLLPSDRRFFTTSAAPFAYDPDAPQPVEWLRFLSSVWPDDPDSIATLQEWFGYMLTPDTRQQKILFIVGPRRGGKGTIARVLRELVGPLNLASPTLASLATNFGLWPLIGKSVALVADARIGPRTDTALIVERLLSISGEDPLTIDRKHREPLTAKLTCRFVILSNEMLRLGDSSGALVGRFIVLRATQSFYGREDHGLFDRLKAELPGILLWAIEGWRRLRARGRFAQPATGHELIEDMESLSSPVGAYVREKCVLGPAYRVAVSELYHEWKLWCDSHGRKEPGVEEVFGQQLRAAVPSISKSRPRTPEGRVWVYAGIGLSNGSGVEVFDDEDRGPCVVQARSMPGPSENPTNPGVVHAVIANTKNLVSYAHENISGAHAHANGKEVRGHGDHVDHMDHPAQLVNGMGTCSGCGKPSGSMFTRTCKACLDKESAP